MQTGRPPKFKNAKELQNKFDKYVKECLNKEERPTITGAAYELGFESRQSLYDYEKQAEFSYAIKRIRLFIENIYEKNIEKGAGFIFALKNFGWTDTQVIDQTNHYPDGIQIQMVKSNEKNPLEDDEKE